MKIKVLALAVAAMAFTVACNNNKTVEEAIDSVIEEPAVEDIIVDEANIDTVATAVVEEVKTEVKKAAAKVEKEVKKAEPVVTNNEDGTKTVSTTRGSRTAEEKKAAAEPTVTNNEDGTKTVSTTRGSRKK